MRFNFNFNFSFLVVISALFLSGCGWIQWGIVIETNGTRHDERGVEYPVHTTTVLGGPQRNRAALSMCEADSQCSSEYCYLGACIAKAMVPRDGRGHEYHIHERYEHNHPYVGRVDPECEHDNPRIRGYTGEHHNRKGAELSADRRNCPGFRIGPTRLGEHDGVDLQDWQPILNPPVQPVIYRRDQAQFCRVVWVVPEGGTGYSGLRYDGYLVYDCPPLGEPYLTAQSSDYMVSPADLDRAEALGPRRGGGMDSTQSWVSTTPLLFAQDPASGELWLDGPQRGLPSRGRGPQGDPPYSASYGDFRLPDQPWVYTRPGTPVP